MRRKKCVICRKNYIDEGYEFYICDDCLAKVVPEIIKMDSNLMHWTMIFLINIWAHGFNFAMNLMKKKKNKNENQNNRKESYI
jgi:hypothetical protein